MMRKVRTRVWSTLIAVAMLLTMLPTMALAADLPTAGNDSITLTDGVYELSGDTQLSVPSRSLAMLPLIWPDIH